MRKILRVTHRKCLRCSLAKPILAKAVLGLFLVTGIPQATIAQENHVRTVEENLTTLGSKAPAISGKELMTMHPTDLLKALQLLDPSIVIDRRETLTGSDPNHVPSSLTQPGDRAFGQNAIGRNNMLVIVDGYEIPLDRLADFDIAQVASVRIIKNAQESARYGIRGANGIIEITTLTPEKGNITLNYRLDLGVQTILYLCFFALKGRYLYFVVYIASMIINT